jgi:hypothetical protein
MSDRARDRCYHFCPTCRKFFSHLVAENALIDEYRRICFECAFAAGTKINAGWNLECGKYQSQQQTVGDAEAKQQAAQM